MRSSRRSFTYPIRTSSLREQSWISRLPISTNYYYGVVNPVRITDKTVGGNEGKKALIEVTTDTDHGLMAREPQFYLDASNMLQNISLTKSFSFDIYIEDADARSFLLQKARYYNWSNTPFGTCRRTIPSNQWVTVTFQRENYDTELGGYIFAGSDQSLGGVMWTADDDRFISNFYIGRFPVSFFLYNSLW